MMLFLRVTVAGLVGAVFVLSGFLKLIDPVGTALKLTEYFNVLGLSWLEGSEIYFGSVLSLTEFTLGIALLFRLRLRNLSYLLLAFMAVFTPLTAYLAFFNPIQDCGCFGEAVHLTNMQTFLKNVVLLLLSVFIFFQRKKYRRLSSRAFEWGLIGFIAAMGLFTGIYSFFYLPPVEFSVFNPGRYMVDVVSDLNQQEKQFETRFVYERDGERSEFSLEEIAGLDSTWSYVSSETLEIVADSVSEREMMSLPIMRKDGTYITDMLSDDDLNLLMVVIYSSDISDRKLERIAQMLQEVAASGNPVMPLVLCSADDAFVEKCERMLSVEVYRSDYKSLITLNRSNGGIVLVGSGEIIKKWSVYQLPRGAKLEKVLNTDARVQAVEEEIHSRLFWEILAFAGVVIIVLLNLILSRYNVKHNIVRTKSDGSGEDAESPADSAPQQPAEQAETTKPAEMAEKVLTEEIKEKK